MLKNLLFAAFFTLLCFSFSFAQTSKKSGETNWEILQVSSSTNNCRSIYDPNSVNCRRYNFITSREEFEAQESLEWMKESNWELVGAEVSEGFFGLYFKRRYDKQRTEKEIEWLKKEYKKISSESKSVPQSDLIDLDLVEYKQKAIDLGKSEKAKYENLLKQINEFPLKVISVETTSYDPTYSRVKAEIVLDATNVLIKEGKNYRSSEAEKYFRESSKIILEKLNLQTSRQIGGDSWGISQGKVVPLKVGNFDSFAFYAFYLKISVIVKLNNQEIIVSQDNIFASVKKDNK